MDHFDDIGPSVVMASPGMMQSGLSRELFESWCTDKRNGVIIAGYCVEGTLAKVRAQRDSEKCFYAKTDRFKCTRMQLFTAIFRHRSHDKRVH